MLFTLLDEVRDREIDEIESSEELEECKLDEPRGEEECDPPKNIRSDDPIFEGFLLVVWLQVLHHSCEDCCIVDREDSFHEHEANNDDEIRRKHNIFISKKIEKEVKFPPNCLPPIERDNIAKNYFTEFIT